MMNSATIKIAILLTFVIVMVSCRKDIDFELNNEINSRLVVDGGITDQQKAHRIELTRTSSYYENQVAPKETGATVTISDGSTTFPLSEISDGVYETGINVKGVIGKNYTLNINTKDGKSYTASAQLNSVSAIDTITFEYVSKIVQGGVQKDGYELKHWGQESSAIGNCYMWLVYVDNELATNKINDIRFVKDDFVNGNYIVNFPIYIIESAVVDTVDVRVEMHSISLPYYEFLSAIRIETSSGLGLFDGPPANIPSNISNGALGWFEASAVSEKSIEVYE